MRGDASQTLKSAMGAVTPSFTGYVNTLGGAQISTITDASTGSSSGTITPGGIIMVKGQKIKCVDASGSGLGAVEFLDASTSEVAASVTSLAQNTNSTLIFTCPELASGSYVLRITTYFTKGALLKTARQITSDTLTVAASE